MKLAVVFLITFLVVIISAKNSNSLFCGVAEQARIRQLETENQQLKTNNQALAAAGGMNVMAGFLSGYAGSQNSAKCREQDSSNDLANSEHST